MPWADWQFLTVTAAAAWGAWVLLRQVVPRSNADGDAPCAGCASGSAACSRRVSVSTAASTAAAARTSPLVVLDERR